MAATREATADRPQGARATTHAAAVCAAVPFMAVGASSDSLREASGDSERSAESAADATKGGSDVPSAPLPGGFETRFEHHCEPLAGEERASDGNDSPDAASEASEPEASVAVPRADRHAPALATCRSQVARSLKLRKARQQVEALFWDS